MKISSIILILIWSQLIWGQSRYVDKVNLDIHNQPIEIVFAEIEQATNTKFSFNTDLINRDSIVSYQCRNKSTRKVIKDLFDDRILVKRIGHHVVLIENVKKTNSDKKILNNKAIDLQPRLLSGTILDARTKEGILDVNIYDVYSKETYLTDSKGRFVISILDDNHIKTYNIAKKGYRSNIISIDWHENKTLDVELIALEKGIDLLNSKSRLLPIEEKSKFLLGLVPKKSLLTADNLQDVNERETFQISLLPTIGTDWMSRGVIANNYSFNILAGYNGGVDGFELGGLVNIIDKNMNGVQIAGLSNLVAGNVKGFQLGGILNRTRGKLDGVQVAGIVNETQDTIDGFQIAGIYNKALKPIKGSQIAGVVNYSVLEMKGVQLAGISNRCQSRVIGAQVAGIVNILANTLDGYQVAGIINKNKSTNSGGQIASIANKTEGKNDGFQLSLYNRAKDNSGVQIGLVNYSENSDGIAFGLFNYVKHGYKALEISGNEFMHANIKIKTGVKHFYTIYTAGMRPENTGFYSAGLGIGSRFSISKRASISVDITSSLTHMDNGIGMMKKNQFRNLNNRLDISFDFNVFKGLDLIVGPSYNVLISNVDDSNVDAFKKEIIPYGLLRSDYKNNILTSQWIGGIVGLRYSF